MKAPITSKARNPKQLISAIKRYRKLKKMTQKALGESAGVPQTSVSKIEVELIDPTLTTLFKLLAALDLELSVQPRQKNSDRWLTE